VKFDTFGGPRRGAGKGEDKYGAKTAAERGDQFERSLLRGVHPESEVEKGTRSAEAAKQKGWGVDRGGPSAKASSIMLIKGT